VILTGLALATTRREAHAGTLYAGASKVDVTDRTAGPVNDPLYVKALVLKDESNTVAIITVDAVAIGEIGPIKNDYLSKVRTALQRDLGIEPNHVLVNASHCHGIVCSDVDQGTIKAVKEANERLVPVKVGAGSGFEDRVMENRRLRLKNGREIDMRHAYSLPPDEEVGAVGPVDPRIGLLRLDRVDGRPLAVVYNFACHPIQGVPNKGNTADMTGFASQVIEDNLGEGTVALFLQGCGGDINPITYKDTANPRNAEPLGNTLGLSALKGIRSIETRDDPRLKIVHEHLALPRANLGTRISEMEKEIQDLVQSLKGTSLNLKSFLALISRQPGRDEFPSYASHRYLTEKQSGRDDLRRLDAENQANMTAYIKNIYAMEQITRMQTNLALLRKHQEGNQAAGSPTVDVEVVGLRVGEFVLVTFPGELTVQIGLNIKKASPHRQTYVAGYTNGYIYYAPTAEQLKNRGGAQEDSDCILAPAWQNLFEQKAAQVLERL